jgi:hypothetical protein
MAHLLMRLYVRLDAEPEEDVYDRFISSAR